MVRRWYGRARRAVRVLFDLAGWFLPPVLAGLVVGAAAMGASPVAATSGGTPVAGATAAGGATVTGSIIVRAAAGRDLATGDPVPLAGALLRAHHDAALTDPAGECTTDATGSCEIGGLPPGTYWVSPAGDPAHPSAPGTPGAPDAPPVPLFTRLGTLTTSWGEVPYAEAVTVGEGTPTTRRFAWRRANPAFPARCGVRLTLVYDLSGSIDAGEAAAMRDASLEFVDALAGTPSQIAVHSFATDAPAAGNTDLALTPVDTATGVTTVKDAIAGLALATGDDRFTNWDAALRRAVNGSDVVVLFTDGNPTVHGVPAVFPPVHTGLDQIDAGVLSANAVKAAGSRVLAVGVGDVDEISSRNLAAVAGPVEGSDWAITTFADVRGVFRALADALCPKPEPPVLVSPAPEPVPVPPRFTG